MDNKRPEIGSPTRTRAIMESYGLKFKKSLGQNFLTDINILKKIVSAADVGPDDDVIEVGPGIGALTEQLAQKAHQVLALEIDQRLIPVLKETLADYDNVDVVNQDILKANLPELVKEKFDGQHHLKVVANLPYYITTRIILDVLESEVDFETIVVMIQKEVAARLAAQPGNKDYGSLSVAVQYAMDVSIDFIVPKTVFIPQPKVDSAIVVLKKRHDQQDKAQDDKHFNRLVRGCFAHRRKSLWNNLQGLYGKQKDTKETMKKVLDQLDISQSARAEQLSVADFVRLSDALLAAGIN